MYLKEKLCSQKNLRGSGCGSVGRAFSSNYGGPWFESSHRQKFTLNVYCQLYGKDENKEIEAEMGPILKKNLRGSITVPPVYFVWIQLLCLC